MTTFMARASTRWTAAAAVVLLVVALATLGEGISAVRVPLRTAQAWLSNAGNATVSLIDGFSGESIGQARAANVPGRLSVVNTPNGAVIIDPTGHVNRIGNATMTAGRPRTLFSNTTAVAGAKAVYAVDEATGQVQELSITQASVRPIGPVVMLGGAVSSALVDTQGKLWAALPHLGKVESVRHGAVSAVGGVGQPDDDLRVVAAADKVVSVDVTTRTVMPIGFGSTIRLPVDARIDTATTLVGSDTQPTIAFVGTGQVVTVDLVAQHVSTVDLPAAVRPGAAVMVDDRVALIDKVSGGVLVVHTGTRKVDAAITLAHGRPDELVVKDGQVFVNDSTGDSAVVLHPNGTTSPITKYTPATTNKALHPPSTAKPPPLSAPTKLPGSGGKGRQGPSKPGKGGGAGGGSTPAGTSKPPTAKPGAPGQPQQLALAPGNASIVVNWAAAPANGSNITTYKVSWTDGSGTAVGSREVRARAALTYTIPGLDNGSPYSVAVSARNAHGYGSAATRGPVTPSSEVPAAPGAVEAATTEVNSIDLSWAAPDHGYRISGYEIYVDGTPTPVAGSTGTTTSVPVDGTTLQTGTTYKFLVSAKGANGTEGAKSPVSNAVTPYGPPNPPSIDGVTSSVQGTTATVAVSCDDTCRQGGTLKNFAVTLDPAPSGGQPAAKDTSSTSATIDVAGLNPNSTYTVTATATVSGGTSGPSASATLATTGPASVQSVSADGTAGDGRNFVVSASVGGTAQPTQCEAWVDGVTNPESVACSGQSTLSQGVPSWYTAYTIRFRAKNAANEDWSTNSTSGRSDAKPMTADSRDAFGPDPAPGQNCPSGKVYCGGNSGSYATASFDKGNGNSKPEGTAVRVECSLSGGKVTGYGNYSGGRTTWVRIANDSKPYMSILYFPNPDGVTAGIPAC